jgi:predicted heme/steroid binding protein
MKKYSINSLKKYDGDNELEIYVSNNGLVYDVSDCPKWKTGLHESIHFGGQNLTEELPNVPHNDSVFKHPCVKLIGSMEEK